MTYDIENFGITHIEDRKGGEVIYEEKIGSEAYNNKILASAQKYGDEAVAIAKKDIETESESDIDDVAQTTALTP